MAALAEQQILGEKDEGRNEEGAEHVGILERPLRAPHRRPRFAHAEKAEIADDAGDRAKHAGDDVGASDRRHVLQGIGGDYQAEEYRGDRHVEGYDHELARNRILEAADKTEGAADIVEDQEQDERQYRLVNPHGGKEENEGEEKKQLIGCGLADHEESG